MRIDIITLFPKMFEGPFAESIIKRAQEKGFVEIKIHDLRSWAVDKRGTVDDRPYGGGTGMIIMIQPVYDALESLKPKTKNPAEGEARQRRQKPKTHTKNIKTVLLSPSGKVWNQKMARGYSKLDHLTLVCGHYEGVDERIRKFVDEEISIGDYILTGGEIPAMVILDSVVRLIPGVLEKPEATKFESFSNSKIPHTTYHILHTPLLEYSQYTRPENFHGLKVPKILLSGNHQKISQWRTKKALERTKKRRPDLLKRKMNFANTNLEIRN